MQAGSIHSVLWKCLDREGHDACRFRQDADGWSVDGTAVLAHAGDAACLTYRLICDAGWQSLSASVSGWIGSRTLDISIERTGADLWIADGTTRKDLAGLRDIDLGFTPASNTNAIRRLNLAVGEDAETVALWLDSEDWTPKPLRQRYRRVGECAYEYTSPHHGYRATLQVDRFGAIREYPDLWVAVPVRESEAPSSAP